MRSTLKNSS